MAANEVMLEDGFSTIITLENIPTVKLYEKEVTPPGINGGGPIDTTTMRNTAWRTQAPKHLKSSTPISATVAYATDSYDEILAQIGVNQQMTVTQPDGSTITIWGWLDEFTPGANTEGEQPTATLTFQPSNRNNDEPPVETGPVYTAPEESSGA